MPTPATIDYGYLELPYLSYPYLSAAAAHAHAMQVLMARAHAEAMQARIVIYNDEKFRVLYEFPSRGTTGMNWTATSTAAGDFSVNNVNTDIVEQAWRSATGILSVNLVCDTELAQGVAVDTIGILGHNLSRAAVISVEASNSPVFASVPFVETIDWSLANMYWIAETFPFDQYRYWRFNFSDPTNPANFLQVGTIVFGSSLVFSGTCFADGVGREKRHFADKIQTAGFTNVSNDRAVKRAVRLEFPKIRYDSSDFIALEQCLDTVRTSLKALWIPTPQDPTRFAVFGKATEIPPELHDDKSGGVPSSDANNVTLSLNLDEAM